MSAGFAGLDTNLRRCSAMQVQTFSAPNVRFSPKRTFRPLEYH
jgi:hypothetical protein